MIQVKLPDRYPLTTELVHEFALLNSDLKITSAKDNILIIGEDAYKFEDVELVELLFPSMVFEDNNFDELYEINAEKGIELNFEQSDYHSILFKMGTFAIISVITMAISATLYYWATKNKTGRVYNENGEYHLDKTKKAGKKGSVYMADASFISYKTASEDEQKSWKGRAQKAPTFIIEIVSAKKSLKQALRKMKNIWIHHGTKIGVVIDPFSKRYFVFEQGKNGFTERSIYTVFTHPLLPGYEGDFSAHVDEIE